MLPASGNPLSLPLVPQPPRQMLRRNNMRQSLPLGHNSYPLLHQIDLSWADVKLNEIRRSVPPTVKWTITSDQWLQGHQARDAFC